MNNTKIKYVTEKEFKELLWLLQKEPKVSKALNLIYYDGYEIIAALNKAEYTETIRNVQYVLKRTNKGIVMRDLRGSYKLRIQSQALAKIING